MKGGLQPPNPPPPPHPPLRPVRLVFSSISNQAACLLLNPTKPYRGVNFPYQPFSLSSIIDATKLFKVLRVRYCTEEDHAHSLSYVYGSIDRNHAPITLAVFVTTHLQVGRLIRDTLI